MLFDPVQRAIEVGGNAGLVSEHGGNNAWETRHHRRHRQGLDGLPLTLQDSTADWTKGIKTMLCKLGHKFGYQAYGALGRGEWLYDVTWMAYSQGYEQNDENNLVDAHLVAECEWGSFPG